MTRQRSDGSGFMDMVSKLNIDPFSPPDMRTLVYSPDVRVEWIHNGKVYNASKDIVRVQLNRKENAASTSFITLTNKGGRYSGNIMPMDRITIYMKRISWVQVFSGYADTVPHAQLYQGTITIKATCTLKRLLHTWWNPALAQSAALFGYLNVSSAVGGDGQLDTGLGSLLVKLMTDVGGWNRGNIHVSNFPVSFYNFLVTQIYANQSKNQAAVEKFKHLLLGDDITGGSGASASYSGSAGAPGPIGSGQAFYVEQIVAACDDYGLGPNLQNLQNAQYLQQAAEIGAGAAGMDSSAAANQKAWEQSVEAAAALQTGLKNNDAAILGVACALGETGLRNLANLAIPESLRFANDGTGSDHDSVGLFQQRNFKEWGCLPGSARVFTAQGPKRIESIKVDDLVWADDGDTIRLRRVQDQGMTGYRPTVTVRTRGRIVECTPDHRIPVMRYFGRKDGRAIGECGWTRIVVQAQDIRKGDHLIVPHGMRGGTRTTDPDGNLLTVGVMELVGLYLGDGNLDKHAGFRGRYGRVEIAHGSYGIYNDHVAHYHNVIRSELGVEPYVNRGTATRFSSPFFYTLIADHFPGDCYTKALPDWVYELTPELQLALLRGYLDSDGTVDKSGRLSWASVSEELITGFWHLCVQLGIPVANITKQTGQIGQLPGQKPHLSADTWWLRCSVPAHSSAIGSNSPHKATRLNSTRKHLKTVYDRDWNLSQCRRAPLPPPPKHAVYHKVIAVSEPTHEVFPVYNLTVEGDHNYCADGVIVMNSLSQRMNPRQSARMFFDHLKNVDWRNMDAGQAIYQVQRGGSVQYYNGFINQAKQLVQAVREAQQGAATAVNSNPITGGVSSVAGAAGIDVASSVNSAVGTATSAPDPNSAAKQLGKPDPDNEGAVMTALESLGTPYVWGGKAPGGFDCSGLTTWAFRSIGINIGDGTGAQMSAGQEVPHNLAALRRGDLIFPHAGHVVIYLGDGTIVHAPQTGDVVRIAPMYFDISTVASVRRVAQNGGPNPAAPRMNPMIAGPGVSANVGGASGLGGGTGGTHSEQIARNLFSYMFEPMTFASGIADMWGLAGGHKDFIDAQPLIQMIQAVCSSSLRNFQSAPNGDFIAYYPDYFGLDGKPATLKLEDIELKDVHVDYSDDNLTTHVYVAGDTTMYGQMTQVEQWLDTAGTATVEDEWLFQRLRQVGLGDNMLSGQDIMRRFGVRPLQYNATMSGSHELEFLMACQTFMEKWASQYQTQASFTFMPELFPGMRVILGDHKVQVYVSEVTHVCDFAQGFSTSATIMAPSNPSTKEDMANVRTTASTPDISQLFGVP